MVAPGAAICIAYAGNQARTDLTTIPRQPGRGKRRAPMNHDICMFSLAPPPKGEASDLLTTVSVGLYGCLLKETSLSGFYILYLTERKINWFKISTFA